MTDLVIMISIDRLIRFYVISTLVGYLILTPIYTYVYIEFFFFQRRVNKNNFKRAKAHLFANNSMVPRIPL